MHFVEPPEQYSQIKKEVDKVEENKKELNVKSAGLVLPVQHLCSRCTRVDLDPEQAEGIRVKLVEAKDDDDLRALMSNGPLALFRDKLAEKKMNKGKNVRAR